MERSTAGSCITAGTEEEERGAAEAERDSVDWFPNGDEALVCTVQYGKRPSFIREHTNEALMIRIYEVLTKANRVLAVAMDNDVK